MKLKSFLILASFIQITCGIGFGQNNYSQMGKSLERLFTNITVSEEDSEKSKINDSILILVDQYVKTDSVFNHRFSNLRYMGQITSPDSLLKIITWNLPFSNGEYSYYSFFLKRGSVKAKPQVFKLSTGSGVDEIRTDTIYNTEDWYGALYYEARPFTIWK